MMISTIHQVTDTRQGNTIKVPTDTKQWNLELKIDIFFYQVDGWYLEIADRMLNGWRGVAGEDYIQGIHPDKTLNANQPANYIPDSAFAALQIMINYFETVRFYKTANENENTGDRFKAGVRDVFPEFGGHIPPLEDVLYHQVRSRLYHAIYVPRGKQPKKVPSFSLSRPPNDVFTFYYQSIENVWLINPHSMIRRLREHLVGYAKELKDTSQKPLRDVFEQAFDKRTFGKL